MSYVTEKTQVEKNKQKYNYIAQTYKISALVFHIIVVVPSHPVMSNSPQPHGLQHAKPPCPSPSSRVCPSLCPLYRRCHPTISCSVTLFSFCLQSFPASGYFPMSQLLASGDQSIGASVSESILIINI